MNFPAQKPAAAPSPELLDLKEAVARLEARLNADTGNSELLSRLRNVERSVAVLANIDDKDNVQVIRTLQTQVAALSKQVTTSLARDKSGIPVIVGPYIEAVVDQIVKIEKDINSRQDTAIGDIQSDFRSLAKQIQSSVEQLSAIANTQTVQASEKLMSAARFFSSAQIGKPNGAKGVGIVENTILRGVSQS